MQEDQLRYLTLLSEQYPSIQAASNAIINLTAQLYLPKETEHFLSDVHGEYEAFQHVIKNGAGSIRRKIDEMFANTLSTQERKSLATLIYYPEHIAPLMLQTVANKEEWCRLTLGHLIKLCRLLISKYQRIAVRGFLAPSMSKLIDELLYEREASENKSQYYQHLIETIITTHSTETVMIHLSELIQRLAIARLHVIGDIYDRGDGAHLIMDALIDYHQVDIQWGNHDILWMGAAAGSEACIANVIRFCLRYANMKTLETGYGISLMPLISFALDTYENDPCDCFIPKVSEKGELTNKEIRLMAQMHKAITIIQFKLEGQLIKRRPHYRMSDRLLLDKIDYAKNTIMLDGNEYPLLDHNFPTIDPNDPYSLTEAEKGLIDKLKLSFENSKKIQQHVRLLFSKGSIYLIHNGNLLYHGCIALNDDGSFKAFNVDGREYAGKDYLDRVDRLARQGYFMKENSAQKRYGMDAMWYLWCGEQSPLFGKEKMATFERYFIADPETHKEKKNTYYAVRDKEETVYMILDEFGLRRDVGHIINGHVPVKVANGERPVKANGKLIVIDGGFSKAYQGQTGIAGYTLISNSQCLLLAAHHPFKATTKSSLGAIDMDSETEIIETYSSRMWVKDTDHGFVIQQNIQALQTLVNTYREGIIKEQRLDQ